ncbi:phage protein NinX family protein [Atlantibacter hermannii]|uniref:phage protein NinX family protein n=1 Tax=Atlantibacter hermannii TaxID=565 RepID=UPI0028A02EA2|nr:phage protein NinX family protein [Atlantibacter hermannii]
MTDYSKLSDFEINLAVAHSVIGSGGYDWCSDKKEVYFAGLDGGEFLPNAYFDPCNNPADAWPIIAENGIGIRKQSNCLWCVSRQGGLYPQYHENPLRAALIVFLMMQDSSHANS